MTDPNFGKNIKMPVLIALALLFVLIAPAVSATIFNMSHSQPMGDRTKLFKKQYYTSESGAAQIIYYILGPKKLQRGYKYPLIVSLHSRSGTSIGPYNLSREIIQNNLPVFVLVPVVEPGINSWYEHKYTDGTTPLDHTVALTKGMAQAYPIDDKKIYVTGCSMGGMGAFAALKQYPDVFAAGHAICGGWQPGDTKGFEGKPIWIINSIKDPGAPIEHIRTLVKNLKKNGAKPHYTEYEDADHIGTCIDGYQEPDIWFWLLSQQ